MSTDDRTNGGGDKVIALLPWDMAVRRARSRRHAHQLLERKDADQAIRGLSEVEAYYLVKELGPDAASPVLAVLEPEQIRALVDLDCWQGDHPRVEDLLLWLAALKEASAEQLGRAVRSLDPELMALVLARRLHVALKPREEEERPGAVPDWLVDPPEGILPLVETPDHRFIIAARTHDAAAGGGAGTPDEADVGQAFDEEERKQILELVDLLYRDQDFEYVAGLLRLAESDSASDLEEYAYRFKVGRLEDLGFPERARALELYLPLDPDRALAATEPTAEVDLWLPSLHAERLTAGLFQQALYAVEGLETARRIEGELVALSNAALVADGVAPGDLEHLRLVLDRVRAYLELGLSYRADGAHLVAIARERLETHALRSLFRAGYSLTLALATRARALAASRAFAADGDPLGLLAERDRQVLVALLLTRPQLSRALDEPPLVFETRPFASVGDLERVRGVLAELEALRDAAARLRLAEVNAHLGPGVEPPLAAERSVDLLLATAGARALLGEAFAPEPLDARALQRLVERALPDERGRLAFPEAALAGVCAVAAAAGATGPAVERRLRAGLTALVEGLVPLAGAAAIDPRFVAGVVRRVG